MHKVIIPIHVTVIYVYQIWAGLLIVNNWHGKHLWSIETKISFPNMQHLHHITQCHKLLTCSKETSPRKRCKQTQNLNKFHRFK